MSEIVACSRGKMPRPLKACLIFQCKGYPEPEKHELLLLGRYRFVIMALRVILYCAELFAVDDLHLSPGAVQRGAKSTCGFDVDIDVLTCDLFAAEWNPRVRGDGFHRCAAPTRSRARYTGFRAVSSCS